MTRERHLEEPEILATGEDEELEDEVSSPDFWGEVHAPLGITSHHFCLIDRQTKLYILKYKVKYFLFLLFVDLEFKHLPLKSPHLPLHFLQNLAL